MNSKSFINLRLVAHGLLFAVDAVAQPQAKHPAFASPTKLHLQPPNLPSTNTNTASLSIAVREASTSSFPLNRNAILVSTAPVHLLAAMGNICGKESKSDNFSQPGRVLGTAPTPGPKTAPVPKKVGGPPRTLGGSSNEASGDAGDARKKAAQAAEVSAAI